MCCVLTELLYIREVCLSLVVQDVFTQDGDLCQPDLSRVAPDTFVRVWDSVHTLLRLSVWEGSRRLCGIVSACVFLF